jgi:outer membrane protein assembly factor BamB
MRAADHSLINERIENGGFSMPSLIFIGVHGTVLGLDKATGTEIWRTKLRGSDFVNVAVQDGDVFASSKGEIYCLRPDDGGIRWHNKLEGLGWGLVTIAGDTQNAAMAQKIRRDQAAAAAGSAGAAGAA